ncbi:MAG: hypothetical protein K8T90_12460 [Planctomycetes bacterium]|nr:hypothetical protein [Planctomycetota bacterium]
MKIGEKLKRWRDLSRLRSRLRRDASPSAYGDLAERLISAGSVEEALAVAEEGLRAFPDSERLAQVRLFSKRGRLTGQIRRLRDDVLRRPTPVVYTQLAGIYRELGSHDEALQTAQECAERFPLNENPYLIQGEIRLERFLLDVIARDAILAEQALRRVTRINGHNVKAHLLLAELYWLTGAVSACRRHLRSVLTITPTARDVQDFMRQLGQADAQQPEAEEDFEELAKRIEEIGTFANATTEFPGLRSPAPGEVRSRTRVDVDSLKLEIAELGHTEGVRSSILLDKDGEILADCTDGMGLTRKQFGDLVTSVSGTADDASRRMDTGALVRVEIETPAGSIMVARVRGLTIGMLFAEPLRADRLWEILQDSVARNMSAADREGAHA